MFLHDVTAPLITQAASDAVPDSAPVITPGQFTDYDLIPTGNPTITPQITTPGMGSTSTWLWIGGGALLLFLLTRRKGR